MMTTPDQEKPNSALALPSDPPTNGDRDSLAARDSNSSSKSHPLKVIWTKFYNVISWTPPRCRWDPENPPKFNMVFYQLPHSIRLLHNAYSHQGLNVLFAFAGAFTVANLYYNHPILDVLSKDFNVPYEKISQIPTVMQAGYAVGLLFLCPLGDLLRRRAFVCSLMFFTATLW